MVLQPLAPKANGAWIQKTYEIRVSKETVLHGLARIHGTGPLKAPCEGIHQKGASPSLFRKETHVYIVKAAAWGSGLYFNPHIEAEYSPSSAETWEVGGQHVHVLPPPSFKSLVSPWKESVCGSRALVFWLLPREHDHWWPDSDDQQGSSSWAWWNCSEQIVANQRLCPHQKQPPPRQSLKKTHLDILEVAARRFGSNLPAFRCWLRFGEGK